MNPFPPPLGLLAELTHRCPLQCPYCSNPVELTRATAEMPAEIWVRVFKEAAALGVLQLHLSGGEPMARADIMQLVNAAADAGLYTNLITSAVTLDEAKIQALKSAGLDHIQISVQGADASAADRVANMTGAAQRKSRAAEASKRAGLALTMNAVIHRQNTGELEQIIELCLQWGAERLEVAHVQYYGWALANRTALLPTREDVLHTTRIIEDTRIRLKGKLVIDYVIPDYYAERPKACMGGWGRQVIVVAPDGAALPCHAARTIPDLAFDNVKDRALSEIWRESAAFNMYRGTEWMSAPCRGCPRAEIDWGGCRCQALALTGRATATDPACELSPDRRLLEVAQAEAQSPPPDFRYRRFNG
jgi:pyrroloquinoline quinone biosynthesis protein E